MLILPTALVEFVTNKLGHSVVFYKSLGRQFARDYVVPFNPQSDSQDFVRIAFKAATEGYSALDLSDVADWAAFAALMPVRIDPLGRSYAWTAKSIYMAIKSYEYLAQSSIAGGVPGDHVVFSVGGGTVTYAAGNLTIPIIVPGAATSTSNAITQIRITRPLPGGVRLARRTDLRYPTADPQADAFVDTSAGGTVNAVIAGADILDRLGFTPSPGDRIGVELQPLSEDYVPGYAVFYQSDTIA